MVTVHGLRLSILSILSLPVLAGCGSSGDDTSTGTSSPSGTSGAGGSGGNGGSGGGAAGSSAAGAGGTSGGASGAAGGVLASPCKNPMPLQSPNGAVDEELCENGLVHRKGAPTCTSKLPQATECTSQGTPLCSKDSDCTEHPNGLCEAQVDCAGPCSVGPCGCTYGCKTDAECGAGQYCVCGDAIGRCSSGGHCKTDADCPSSLCLELKGDCSVEGFACVTAQDECLVDADCSTPGSQGRCRYQEGKRTCLPGFGGCAAGRPLLVAGLLRRASLSGGLAWA